MSGPPRLTVGLPVYNGAALLAQSIEALLSQTYEDFELIISDNASTDGTAEICQLYEKQDPRVRYVRQPRNIGSAANHNFVADHARGELFKWASHDDLYARELLARCVDALDACPDVVLAHSWTAMIDSSNNVTLALEYPLATASPRAPERFRSALLGRGGDDFYGVMRRQALPALHVGSHHRSDRTLITGLSLHGPFYQVPEWLYFRREHPELRVQREGPGQAPQYWPERDWPVGRAFCVTMDPRRATRLRHPAVRLYGEYVWGYIAAIRRAPLTSAERLECYRYLAQWVGSRTHLTRSPQPEPPPRPTQVAISVDELVARRAKRAS
jgi:glycosyltransferase involved in cell wall biosynthesis